MSRGNERRATGAKDRQGRDTKKTVSFEESAAASHPAAPEAEAPYGSEVQAHIVPPEVEAPAVPEVEAPAVPEIEAASAPVLDAPALIVQSPLEEGVRLPPPVRRTKTSKYVFRFGFTKLVRFSKPVVVIENLKQ
jgi:hypothetical protein